MTNPIEITGIPIHNLGYEDILEKVDKIINNNHKVYFVTVNPEMVLESEQNEEFFQVLQKSEINTSDGIGILWAAYYLSLSKCKNKFSRLCRLIGSLIDILLRPKRIRSVISERITGADLLPKIIDQSGKKGWKIFLLGAEEGVAKKAAKKMSKIYPQAQFTGHYAGSPHRHDEEEICDYINKVNPDILFVAYGAPKQELWIHRNLFKLESVKVAIGVGGAFDFHAGKTKRAPIWMQKVGLEWVYRLIREPKRFIRIWNATFRFIKLIYIEKNG